ncbi:MAG: hypothetical protein QME51_05115 [Planctomycetota bacterium]|nr:hypothetical protein [Planctomycetota bacterium]MDI6787731.1 hypothetical protein [Planctomycetota bacterium]
MQCPYLEEVTMRYCKAYPIKKMIPASSSQLVSPCFANNTSCPIYQDVVGKKGRPVREPVNIEPKPEQKDKEEKYCVWVRQEMVSYRLCTRNYDCSSCQFEQMLIEQDGKYVEQPQVAEEIEKLRRLPAQQRRCKYTVTGKILLEKCDFNYECWQCSKYKAIRSSIIETCLAEARK